MLKAYTIINPAAPPPKVVTHHHGGMVPFFTERFTTQSQNFDDTEGLDLLEVGVGRCVWRRDRDLLEVGEGEGDEGVDGCV